MRSRIFAIALIMGTPASLPAQEPNPDAFLDLVRQAQARSQARDWAAAGPLWERVVEINPNVAAFWYSLGVARSSAQEHRKAIAALEKARELGAGNNTLNIAYEIARAHGLLGEKEAALEWLQRALDSGLRSRERLRSDAAFALLREDAKFKALAMPADTADMSRADGWRHDLSFLELEVERMHHDAFRKVSKAAFQRAVRDLSEQVDDLTEDEFVVGVMSLLSMIGDGHTGCFPDLVPAWSQSLPVQFGIFREGLFIISATPAIADLVGAQVLRFGEHPWERVLEEVGRIISKDNPQGVLRSGPNSMRYPQILHGLGLQPDADLIQLTVRMPGGEERSVTVDAVPIDTRFNRITGHPDWVTAYPSSPGPLPLYLKDRRTPYWFEHLPDQSLVYFQFNNVTNATSEPFDRFVDRLFQFIDEHKVQKLVIDLRWNNGGNTLLLPPLIRALSRDGTVTRQGNLFVLVGRYTYSAGMNAATFLERHTNATFVGEPTPSSPNFVGESNIVALPYSRINVSISDLFWQSSWPFDRRTWIAPLLYVPPSFEAYKANRDLALEAILASRAGG